jgi:hypothetical protein
MRCHIISRLGDNAPLANGVYVSVVVGLFICIVFNDAGNNLRLCSVEWRGDDNELEKVWDCSLSC